MNAKQSLRAVARHLEEATASLMRATQDIKAYNQCIDHMIAGGSPCDYCEDNPECQLEAKGRGCDMWMLRWGPEGDDGK